MKAAQWIDGSVAAALTRLDMVVASGKHDFKPPPGRFVIGREGVGRRVYFMEPR